MQSVDVADDTYVAAAVDRVAAAVADPARWDRWWPDLTLVTTRDRGRQGHQWRVSGAVNGTMEIWLEPWWDGVLLHYYLREEPPGGGVLDGSSRADRYRAARTQAWKTHVHRLKDELELAHGPESVPGRGDPRRVRWADPVQVGPRPADHEVTDRRVAGQGEIVRAGDDQGGPADADQGTAGAEEDAMNVARVR